MKTAPAGRRALPVLAALTILGAAGCGSGAEPATTSPSAAGASASGYPVTIHNCGQAVRVDRAPERAVSNDVNTTEDMLALGLQRRMVGTFGVGDGAAATIPAAERAAFATVRRASPKYFTLEPLVALRPDFLFAGYNYGLQAGSATLTPAGLARHGITTLALAESCVHVQHGEQSSTIALEYDDLTNLGAIFGARAKAAEVVAGMRAKVAAVQAKVARAKPVSVFLYDSGTDAPFTAPALAMPNALIKLAGGTNVFSGLAQTWTTVSWEAVAAKNPACILINDYDTPSWQQKEQFLRTFKLTRGLTAVKTGCFFHLRYDQLTPSPQNADAVEAIARWLHPEAFGIAARA